MREKVADEIAKRIEHLLSKAQVIDHINNDEIVKRQDYLSVASDVLALIKGEIEKVKNPYRGIKQDMVDFVVEGHFEHERIFEECRQVILNLLCSKENVVGSAEL